MTDVTDADREKAAEIAGWPAKNWTELRDTIAAALAEERQKARAPFHDLAEEMHESGDCGEQDCNGGAYGNGLPS